MSRKEGRVLGASALDVEFAQLLCQLASLGERLLRKREERYFHQGNSPLGRRLHCRLARSGELPASQVGRKLIATESDIKVILERYRVKPTEPRLGTQDEDEELLATIGGSRKTRAA